MRYPNNKNRRVDKKMRRFSVWYFITTDVLFDVNKRYIIFFEIICYYLI